jgi:hypothetical protein
MAIFKSLPSVRIINGHEIKTSDSVILSNSEYITNGEYCIVVKSVDYCVIHLNSETTDHVVIKALTNVLVKTSELIDDEYEEVELSKGSCVEFKKIGSNWYILSSDGMKNS